MSSLDPTAPAGSPTDTQQFPAPLPNPPTTGGASPLNPTLIGNWSLVMTAALVLVSLIGATALSIIHDGAYTQAAFDLYKLVIGFGLAGQGAMGTAHVLVKGFRG